MMGGHGGTSTRALWSRPCGQCLKPGREGKGEYVIIMWNGQIIGRYKVNDDDFRRECRRMF